MIKSGYNSLNESIKYKDTDKIKYLYHSVFSNASKKYVLENGIKSDDQGWIYLSEKPIINSRVVAVFKVRIPDNRKLYDWREIWCDENGNEIDSDHQYDPSNPYYVYYKDIPKKYVELVK